VIKKVLIIGLLLVVIIFTFIIKFNKFFSPDNTVDTVYSQEKGMRCLEVLSFDKKSFDQNIAKAKYYKLETISAGVVPHHLLAGELIATFFKTVKEKGEDIDTVIIIGPNHQGIGADITISDYGWQTLFGSLECDGDLVEDILSYKTLNAEIDNDLLETDHAASNLIPYLKYYLPNAKVVTVLFSRRVTLRQTEDMAEILAYQAKSKKLLVIGSIDFSHGLSVEEGKKKDEVTLSAINHNDLGSIKKMTNEHLDSPETLCTLLSYMEISRSSSPILLDHKNAADYLKDQKIDECTTYFVLGCQ